MTAYVQFLAHGRFSGDVSSFPWEEPYTGWDRVLPPRVVRPQSSLALDEAEPPGLLPPVMELRSSTVLTGPAASTAPWWRSWG